MKLIAIDTCTKPKITDMLHHSMFHGIARRDDVNFPDSPSHYLGDVESHPLLVSICGVSVSPVFKPCNSLVVCDALHSVLSGIRNTHFMPVVFEKLVNFTYRKGDFSYYKTNRFLSNPIVNRSDELLQSLPDDPQLHQSIGRYYEVVVANAFRECDNRHKCRNASFRLQHSPSGEKEFPCSSDFLDSHPIFWGRSVIMHRSVFDAICDQFDSDYFDIAEFIA